MTSYAEVVLAPPAADALHPAFSNLFVQTELVRAPAGDPLHAPAALARRAAAGDVHLMTVHGADAGSVSYETDRARFIGRGGRWSRPRGDAESRRAVRTREGSVLDPIVGDPPPHHARSRTRRRRSTWSPASPRRATACLALIEKYHDRRLADRVFELAWTHSQVLLRQLNATRSRRAALRPARRARSLYAQRRRCAPTPACSLRNRRGQSGLWGYGISGDLPIVLLRIGDVANIELVRQLVQAHAYWRLKGLAVDLVIWNEDHAGYRQTLQDQIMGLIAAGVEAHFVDRPGGIFVRRGEQMSEEDRVLLQTVARVILSDTRGTLAEQIERRGPRERAP